MCSHRFDSSLTPVTDDFFDALLSLTLFEKLVRGQVPDRAMGPTLIVIAPPGFDDGMCLGQGGELVHGQAFITNATVEPKNGNRRVRSPQFLASGRPEGWLLGVYIAWFSPGVYDTRKTNQPVPSK